MSMIPMKEGLKLKYSLTRPRRNHILLVKIKLKGRISLIIPVSLWTLEETLQALKDLSWLGEKVWRVWIRNFRKKPHDKWISCMILMPVSVTLGLGAELIREFRNLGRFRMVEFQDGDNQLFIDLC